jgi:hypothetical protein
MYWGNAGAIDSSNSPAVFDTANGFKGVWHLTESGAIGAAGLYKDATANGNNGDDHISATGKMGIIGLGQQFDGISDYIPTHKWVTTLGQGDFTISFWVFLNGNGGCILSKLQDSVWNTFGQEELYFGDGTTNLNVNGRYPSWVGYAMDYDISGTPVDPGAWHHVTLSWKYDGDTTGTPKYYIDGLPVGLSYTGHNADYKDPSGSTVNIGRQNSNESKMNFYGYLDEFRIDTTVRSAGWVKLCYQNQQANQTLVSLSSCDSIVTVYTKSTLWLLDASLQPLNDTVKIDTTVFHVVVADTDRNINPNAKDTVSAVIKNPSSGDSLVVTLYETGNSTGVFRTASTISIVTVVSGPNQIAMTGGDKLWITYTDPYEPTDVSQHILISKATFPVATRGWLLDTNGDGTVDKAVVAYDKVLTSPPDSITVYFPNPTGAWTVKAGQGSMVVSGASVMLSFSATFPSKTTSFSTTAGGTGISYLNDGGTVKKSVFPLADSIGSVILTAQVAERLAPGIDTLFVTFSEALQPASLAGTSLLLIKNNVSSVLTITSVRALSTGYALALATGMPAPVQGDSLRINPPGPLVDLSNNKAHPLNPPVMIGVKAKPASIVRGYYFDRNADGAVETVEIDFNKKVALNDCIFSLQWALANSAIPSTVNSIDAARLSYKNSDSSIVAINVAALFPGVVGPKTSGSMQATVAFVSFPGQTSAAEVADSAAPVIIGATYIMSTNPGSAGNLGDTLDVDFSEPVQVPPDASPFLLSGKENNTAYSFTLSPLSTQPSATIRFYVKSIDGVVEPSSGDSIWIDSGKVADSPGRVYQINPKNKKAALQVKQSGQWKIMVLINPFSPGTPFSIAGLSGIGTAIKIIPTRTISDLSGIYIQAKIYDALGNLVFESSSPKNNAGDNSFNFIWDGRNKNNRFVGSNTYLAEIIVTTNGVETAEKKLKIGVKR